MAALCGYFASDLHPCGRSRERFVSSARSVIHYGRDNPALARSAEVRYRIMADLRSVLDDSDWTTVFPTSDDTILEMDCLLERVGSDDD